MNTSKKSIVYLCLCVVASVLLASVHAIRLVSFAYSTGEQSYILLVPLVCAALIYFNRERIFRGSRFGISTGNGVALACSAAVIVTAYFFPGDREAQLIVTALGLVMFWAASFWICFGTQALKSAAFELAMMLWIVPIPAVAIDFITVTLQRASAELVDVIFRMTSVPVFRHGVFFFDLPGQSIEVAKECSGIRSTLSLLFLTLILAHESLRSNWRRSILVLCALPIVIIKNGIRIVSLTLLAIYVDPSFLSGPLHHDGGIIFFLLGLAMLMPILSLLKRAEKRTNSPLDPKTATAHA
jgi:exosortase